MKYNFDNTQKQKRVNVKKVVGLIVLIIVCYFVIGNLYRYIRGGEKSAVEEFPTGIKVDDFDKFMQTKKNTASDVKGLSQYDKYKMGLDYRNGSDSDKDGLTDKQEIEVYKTDPLKESTAGDLYTDGYKVKHHMDLFSNCKYQGNVRFADNHCKEVTLTAKEPSDLKAVVEDVTDRYSLECYGINKIYKGYFLYNYGEKIKIDAKNIFSKNDIDFSDINVWVTEGTFVTYGLTDLEEVDVNENNGCIELDYKFDKNSQYYVYITEKKKISINSMLADTTEDEGSSFIYGFPIIEQLFGKGMHIDYSEMATDKKSHDLAKHTVSYCNKYMGSKIKMSDESKINMDDKKNIALKSKVFSFLFPFFEFDPREGATIFNYFFSYLSYTDSGINAGDSNVNPDIVPDEDNNYGTSKEFNIYRDELPFQNFASEIGTSGNCAGISHLTCYLYNKKKFPAKGSYTCNVNGKKKKVKWNLSTDEANKTLMDKELYDYKSSSFVSDHSGKETNYLDKNLTPGEKEFKKMIGCCWTEGNKKIDFNKYLKTNGQHDDYALIERMIKYLDKGKILDVYMLMKSGFGHAVNVYGYQYNDNGEVAFYVYDSNIPRDKCHGQELNFDICALQVKKIKDVNGKDKFEYLYYPLKGRKNITYMASSNAGLMETNSIIVADEEWNILN